MTQRRVGKGEDFIWEEELNLEDCYANYLVACRILSEIYNWLLSDPQIPPVKVRSSILDYTNKLQ